MSLQGKIQPVENFRLHKAQPGPQVSWMWSGARHERGGALQGNVVVLQVCTAKSQTPFSKQKPGRRPSAQHSTLYVHAHVCMCMYKDECACAYVCAYTWLRLCVCVR